MTYQNSVPTLLQAKQLRKSQRNLFLYVPGKRGLFNWFEWKHGSVLYWPLTGLVGLMVGKGQLERELLSVWVCVFFHSYYYFCFKWVTRGIFTTAHCLGTVITILNRKQPVLPKCGVYVGNSGRLVFQIECYEPMCLCCFPHKGEL